eukprot:1136240-Pelagomonas_calceolata.AAC.20
MGSAEAAPAPPAAIDAARDAAANGLPTSAGEPAAKGLPTAPPSAPKDNDAEDAGAAAARLPLSARPWSFGAPARGPPPSCCWSPAGTVDCKAAVVESFGFTEAPCAPGGDACGMRAGGGAAAGAAACCS